MKMTPTLESAALASLHHDAPEPEPQRVIGREVAHELNNILTIIRGYTDRVIIKHGQNPVLRPDLQLISENVRRAEQVIRRATPPRPRPAEIVV